MKEQEAHLKGERAEKKRRLENKANRERQMNIPGADTIDYERQLKKIATRGGIFNFSLGCLTLRSYYFLDIVIALFNAIFQAKKEQDDTVDGKSM